MNVGQTLHHSLRLGNAELPGNLFLAPVAGYSDAAFRSVCIEQGADLCFTEMVSSEALTRGHPKTKELLARAENETRYAIQLFGAKPEVLAAAAAQVLAWKPTLIDLNCGCPVPKIVRSGSGSALIRKPALIHDIVSAMVKAVSTGDGPSVPITVKIRSGWDEGSLNYRETARAAVEAGAAAVTLHARTRAQGYAGKANWDQIAELAATLPVPVFGSGDVFKADDPRRMLAETGCDGVMVARGAMGNPFIFREARAALEGLESDRPSIAVRAAVARRHLELSARFLGERTACIEFRKQFCSYSRGSSSGAQLRAEAVTCSSIAEFALVLDRWVEGARDQGEADFLR